MLRLLSMLVLLEWLVIAHGTLTEQVRLRVVPAVEDEEELLACDRTAADATYTAVNTQVAAATDGQVVCIPAGDETWETTLTITNTRGITLQGAGIGETIIRAGASLDDNTDRLAAIKIRAADANAVSVLSHMTVSAENRGGSPGCTGNCAVVSLWGVGTNQYRVHHVHFANIKRIGLQIIDSTAANGIPTGDEFSGLVDNNIVECSAEEDTSCTGFTVYASPSWNAGAPNTIANNNLAGWGDVFNRPYSDIGSEKVHTFEDNEFRFHGFAQNGAMDIYGSARIRWRFNTHDGPSAGWHGLDSGGARGMDFVEVHNNNIVVGDDANLVHFRSGNGVFFNNAYTSAAGLVINFTCNRCDPGSTLSIPSQGNCDLDGNTSGEVFDGQIGIGTVDGWPCGDQTGWRFSADMSTFTQTPAYFWGNTNGGAEATFGFQTSYVTDAYRWNAEIYEENDAFDGAATVGNNSTGGVGRGTLAARPATCTTGVAYWATDQGSWNTETAAEHAGHGSNHTEGADGVLYHCSATNTWDAVGTGAYTPYAYPHPLRP